MVGFDRGICVFDGRSGVSLDGRWALPWDRGRSVGRERFIRFCGTEEGALGEKSLSGFRKALFCFYVFFFFFNIVLIWKIVEASKPPVLYIYIYIDRLLYLSLTRLVVKLKLESELDLFIKQINIKQVVILAELELFGLFTAQSLLNC